MVPWLCGKWSEKAIGHDVQEKVSHRNGAENRAACTRGIGVSKTGSVGLRSASSAPDLQSCGPFVGGPGRATEREWRGRNDGAAHFIGPTISQSLFLPGPGLLKRARPLSLSNGADKPATRDTLLSPAPAPTIESAPSSIVCELPSGRGEETRGHLDVTTRL